MSHFARWLQPTLMDPWGFGPGFALAWTVLFVAGAVERVRVHLAVREIIRNRRRR